VFFSRRHFFRVSAAGLLIQKADLLGAQQAPASAALEPFHVLPGRSKVALIQGNNRRQNVHDALVAVDDQIRPKLRQKKYVVIKPNNVTSANPLAASHVDGLRGILDYLEPRFKGPVVIAESAAGDTFENYENLGYQQLRSEYRSQHVNLVDLNREAKYETIPLIDFDLHVTPVRLAARLFDPDALVICAAVPKTHNSVVVTLSIKNMTLGAPLHSVRGEAPEWNDKRKYHVGIRQNHYNMFLTARRMQPNWGVTLIDGFEGMEGNGPTGGTPVPSRIAIASTDFIAADRVALETMGINPAWVGYLVYCGQVGLGNYDLSQIDVVGASMAAVRKPYRLHADVERQLQWMGPMNDLPPKLGYNYDAAAKILA